MKIVQRFECERCHEIIEPHDGVIIQGNVYLVTENVDDRSDLVGNNFPAPDDCGTIEADEIREVAYHTICLNRMISDAKRLSE